MMSSETRGKTAITGIGRTDFSKDSGRTVLRLALEACSAAIEDAGVDPEEVDGVVTFGVNDTVFPRAVASDLGLPNLNFQQFLFGGGDICVASVGLAAMAVATGAARHVLAFRAINGRSGHRLGGTDSAAQYRVGRDEEQFPYPAGLLSWGQREALAARRHMLKYGTTSEHYGAVAVTFRENARRNEAALMRDPMTIADHQASRMICEPLRLFDHCLENDGACAVLVSRADEAVHLRQPPVHILAAGQGGERRMGRAFEFYATDDLADDYSRQLAERLWPAAGIAGPEEIDVVALYDCFTSAVISQLEGYGFCPPGEGGPFVADGRIAPDGDIPVNTNGGMLSEAYLHGINGVQEIVTQLRGQAGERQLPKADVGLATGYANTTGSAVVLGS